MQRVYYFCAVGDKPEKTTFHQIKRFECANDSGSALSKASMNSLSVMATTFSYTPEDGPVNHTTLVQRLAERGIGAAVNAV